MNFGETLYVIMYELLSPFGMEDLAYVRRAWDYFPFGDLSEAEQNKIQAAFKEKLQGIVAYLGENGLTIADLTENGEWKSGNEDFIGLLSQLAKSIGSTYDSTTGALVFCCCCNGQDVSGKQLYAERHRRRDPGQGRDNGKVPSSYYGAENHR